MTDLCGATYRGMIQKDGCYRPAGHKGDHVDGSGARWPNIPKPTPPTDCSNPDRDPCAIHPQGHCPYCGSKDCVGCDAEKAALAEALELWSKWFIVPVGQRKGRFKIIADKTDALLADLSPAAKSLMEKAQAHDAMKAENERLRTEIGHWVMAYGPDLVTYPSKEEIRAVNEAPEFRIGRNATMQVVSEGLQAILAGKEPE